MPTVIVEFQIRVVSDELMRKLFENSKGNDLVEIPELPGITMREIKGMSKGYEPLDISGLKDRIDAATFGDAPTAVVFVRKGETIREGGKK